VIVVLLGPPGAGKGTQGVRLSSGLGWHHLSTGDLLREHLREGTELGKRIAESMDHGDLAPDELVVGIVRQELEKLSPESNVIFDGFPRTVAQAEKLTEVLEDMGRRVDLVIVLRADDEILVARLGGRRSCPRCGAVYNLYVDPPRSDEVCDRCGHRGLIHRADDEPETVRNRLEVYHRQTEPLIRYYQGREGVEERVVDAGRTVDQVQRDLRAVVDRTIREGGA
jgi:adenylate kinase